jgi:hypothetical protein
VRQSVRLTPKERQRCPKVRYQGDRAVGHVDGQVLASIPAASPTNRSLLGCETYHNQLLLIKRYLLPCLTSEKLPVVALEHLH